MYTHCSFFKFPMKRNCLKNIVRHTPPSTPSWASPSIELPASRARFLPISTMSLLSHATLAGDERFQHVCNANCFVRRKMLCFLVASHHAQHSTPTRLMCWKLSPFRPSSTAYVTSDQRSAWMKRRRMGLPRVNDYGRAQEESVFITTLKHLMSSSAWLWREVADKDGTSGLCLFCEKKNGDWLPASTRLRSLLRAG